MKHLLTCLTALLLASQSVARAADELMVYPPVPGLAASEHYQVRVRSASDGSKWQSAFAWETVCKAIEKKTDAYFDTLAGWTHIYVNFEAAGAVEIEIARATGEPILRPLAYVFPDGGYENVKDQFLMGDNLLVAPMVTKGTARTVQIPPGTWKADDGTLITGPVPKTFAAPLGRLLHFERQ